jgi:hypothetical protein
MPHPVSIVFALIDWFVTVILFLPFRLIFGSLFGDDCGLPSAVPVITDSTDPSKDTERDKRLELYYSRGYW